MDGYVWSLDLLVWFRRICWRRLTETKDGRGQELRMASIYYVVRRPQTVSEELLLLVQIEYSKITSPTQEQTSRDSTPHPPPDHPQLIQSLTQTAHPVADALTVTVTVVTPPTVAVAVTVPPGTITVSVLVVGPSGNPVVTCPCVTVDVTVTRGTGGYVKSGPAPPIARFSRFFSAAAAARCDEAYGAARRFALGAARCKMAAADAGEGEGEGEGEVPPHDPNATWHPAAQ